MVKASRDVTQLGESVTQKRLNQHQLKFTQYAEKNTLFENEALQLQGVHFKGVKPFNSYSRGLKIYF